MPESKEAISRRRKAHYWKDPEAARAKSLAYYFANKERIGAKISKWQKENKPIVNARQRAYNRKNPVRAALQGVKRRASQQGVKFDLTEDWFLAHFSQGCEATGLDLDAPKPGTGEAPGPLAPHIDRKVHGGDYTQSNCRIVCAAYNCARMDWSDADVLKMAKALVANNPEK